ncbi:MAG: 23S rRNA (uracil(1939)-C(5))-methyltransferase RlmD [Clostridiales Family XIII bacterium]|nr:23S rRNA (uracil(1939)-C(5))-methyltransferase RlmD [Clostridiales Family XIII bacterium]
MIPPSDLLSDCPHSDICGGCTYRGVPYETQLEIKNKQVIEFLQENEVRPGDYAGVAPAPHISAYRNRMDYSFGDEVKDGPMTLGLHKSGSYMSVINTDGCLIVPPDFNTVRAATLAWAERAGHGFYHKKTRAGFLRNLVLRRGERTNELLVNLVTTGEETLDEDAFTDMIRALPLNDTVAGVIHTIFAGRADTVACDVSHVLYGRNHYFEKLLGLDFRVNALSFFQTNTSAVDAMFTEALDMLPEIGGMNVYDVYCGTGTISLSIAGRAASVTGVEIVPESVAAAEENAALNGIGNCAFVCGDALEVLEALGKRPDMIVVDPPRMGMHPKALKKILSYDLPEILYISCNPKTFAQNMAAMQSAGYRLDVLKGYDNFPYTKHTELAARIIRK